ncbi:response regulator transcription factor [Solwaraspora sp. WMMD406]|uniref:response regulator transcription factor n=1 Tax=Solwaraspora sp. WMMD406 TaxID=3016095 RepID=UPI00241622FF|nr:response regulator transcription factor [Solwaraspora sp. WMMD406]MDG4766097.1 response regulator transcription factor [Solwaraspora sp. WMMD406]
MIEIMIVEAVGLLRGALDAVLSSQDDLRVVAGVADVGRLAQEVRRVRPDVVVIGTKRFGPELAGVAAEVSATSPTSRLLVLCAERSPESLAAALRAGVRGFVDADIAPADLMDLVRRVSAGERVVDGAMAVAALRPSANPLTSRERQVLWAVADGLPLREIGRDQHLAYGTVRNHLSRILRKTGARNRLEAVRRAQEEGWI